MSKNEQAEVMEEIIPEAAATLKFARITPRKVKIVADLIRGKDANEAIAILTYTPKAASEILIKLLKSAMANAENNHNMTSQNLYISEIYANQGPSFKRMRPGARGVGKRFKKRTSHITIILREKV